MAIPNQIKLTGTVYIKYIDELTKPNIGDILLLLNDDATSPLAGNYDSTTASGYIKAKIYDGLVWQNVNIGEFCLKKENKFAKKQRAIDSALLCRDIIIAKKGLELHRSYRGHFTIEEYKPVPYIRKASHGRK